ncbi:MAG: NADH:flavin oxidoreductase [Anaerolineales bacterium]|nr:NADH:flavin oxidoreductase [Anaerolineales bacterium]
MNLLFTPGKVGTLELPNRLVRSATAERMADADGRPRDQLVNLYRELARGGVGLIITGHMYVHPSGKAHPEMTGIYKDDLVPDLVKLTSVVHEESGKIAVQINHGGMQSSEETVDDPIAPTFIDASFLDRPAREMTTDEVTMLVDAYAQAARRAKEAGFDAVQIHAAHGYLISEFLSPYVNRRTDDWGGDSQKRMRFLSEVSKAIRAEVGQDYPLLIKLGMVDNLQGGLTPEEAAKVVAELEEMGIDGLEISGAIGGGKSINIKKGIRREDEEAYFLPLARIAQPVTDLPIMLVGGFRSRSVMERVLQDGYADFISICRPLISEPNLPNLMRNGLKDKSRCLSANNCWAKEPGEGISCKCPHDKVEPAETTLY